MVTEWQKMFGYDDRMAPVCLSSPLEWRLEPKKPSKIIPLSAAIPPKPASLEYARFKPYKCLIMGAANKWNTGCDCCSSPPSPFHGYWTPPSRFLYKTRSLLTACILTTDLFLSFPFIPHPTLRTFLFKENAKETLLNTLEEWLQGELPGLSSDSIQRVKSSSLVQTICQICHSGFIDIIKEAFISNKVKPHPMTFIITHLPQDILMRFTMVLSHQSTKNTKSTNSLARSFFWKSPIDGAALHMHSINLWVPSCLDMNEFYKAEKTIGKAKLKGTCCCSCQAVRCELLISDGASPAAAGGGGFCGLFLRGCDGRFPYSGLFPNVNDNPSLRDFAGRREASPETEEGLNVMLQVTNAFLNMQEAMRLCHGGRKTCWAYTEKGREKDFDLENVLRPATYCFPPSCILVFISASCRRPLFGGNLFIKQDLRTVKRFVEGLTVRFLEWIDDPRALCKQEYSNNRCFIIVAEVPELPGRAKALMMPLWEIIPPREVQFKTSFSTEQPRPGKSWEWSETIEVLKRRKENKDGRIRTITISSFSFSFLEDEKDKTITFTLASISFTPTGNLFLFHLIKQVNGSLKRVFFEHFPLESLSRPGRTKAIDEEGINERTPEIFVFYTEACIRRHLLETDAAMFESSFRSHVKICDGVIPAITFFPVRNLANGCLQILLRSAA